MTPSRPRARRRWIGFARWLLLGAVLIVVGVGTALWWMTRPAALQARIDRLVASQQGLKLAYSDVRWVWPDAIELANLQVQLKSTNTPATSAPSLRIARARVGGLLSEMLGRDDPSQHLALENATVRVEMPAGSDVEIDPLKTVVGLLRTRLPIALIDPTRWPTLHAARAQVEFWRPASEGAAPRLVERITLDATAQHIGGGEYEVAISPESDGERPPWILRVAPAARTVTLTSAALDLLQVRDILPPESREALRAHLGDDAELRVDRLRLRWPTSDSSVALLDALDQLELTISGVSGAVTLPLESKLDQRPPYVRYGRQTAGISFDAQRDSQTLGLNVRGDLRQGHCSATAELATDAIRRAADEGKFPALDQLVRTALLKIEGLDAPTRTDHPAFYSEPAAGRKLSEFFHRFQPEGLVDLELRWGLPAPEGAPPIAEHGAAPQRLGVSGRVLIRDGGCVFRGFPYHFQGVTGEIAFAGGRTRIIGLHAPAGLGRVDLSGEVFTPDDWTGVRVHAVAHNIALDRALFEALPTRYQRLWSEVQPLGFADLEVNVSRPTTDEIRGPCDSEINVDAVVKSATLTLNGQRRSPISAAIHVRGGTIEIADLWVSDRNGGLAIAGEITPSAHDSTPPAPKTASQPAITAPITDPRVAGSVPDAVRTRSPIGGEIVLPTHEPDAPDAAGLSILALNFPFNSEVKVGQAGPVLRCDLRTDLSLLHNDDSPRAAQGPIAAKVVGGTIRIGDRGPAWTNVSGEVVQNPDWLNIARLEATRPGNDRLELSGRVARGGSDEVDLVGRMCVADVQRTLDEVLPPAMREIARDVGLHGAATFDARVSGDPTGESPSKPLVANVTLNAAGLRPAALPLDLRNFEAVLESNGNQYELTRATALLGANSKFEVAGGGTIDDGGSRWRAAARDVTIDASLLSAFPETVRNWLAPLAPTGTLQIRVDELRPLGQGRFAIKAAIETRDAALKSALEITNATGSLVGEAIVDRDGRFSGVGLVRLSSARLGECIVSNLQARMAAVGDGGRIRFDELQAQIANGAVSGQFEIDPKSKAYRCDVELAGADLPTLMKLLNKGGQKPPAGRISGRLQLSGSFERSDTRVGEGAFVLERGVFSGTPVLDPLRQAAAKRAAGGLTDRIDRMQLVFVWRGDELQMKEIELSSPDLRLIGAGKWRLSTGDIDLKLVGAHPRDWPRVLLLTDLLEAAQRAFVQFRVGGQWESPKVSIEPLPPVVEGLREIFGGN